LSPEIVKVTGDTQWQVQQRANKPKR
jgi:hypothetical protein